MPRSHRGAEGTLRQRISGCQRGGRRLAHYVSTTARGEIWLAGAPAQGPWYLSPSNPGVAAETQRLRDPVHGLITFDKNNPIDELAWRLIDTVAIVGDESVVIGVPAPRQHHDRGRRGQASVDQRRARAKPAAVTVRVGDWRLLPKYYLGLMPTRNILLTPEQDAFIDEVLKAGEYRNASEVMRDAIRALQQRRAEKALKLDKLRLSLRAGAAALDRGDYAEVEDEDLDAERGLW